MCTVLLIQIPVLSLQSPVLWFQYWTEYFAGAKVIDSEAKVLESGVNILDLGPKVLNSGIKLQDMWSKCNKHLKIDVLDSRALKITLKYSSSSKKVVKDMKTYLKVWRHSLILSQVLQNY